jgi:hypothetical protein
MSSIVRTPNPIRNAGRTLSEKVVRSMRSFALRASSLALRLSSPSCSLIAIACLPGISGPGHPPDYNMPPTAVQCIKGLIPPAPVYLTQEIAYLAVHLIDKLFVPRM